MRLESFLIGVLLVFLVFSAFGSLYIYKANETNITISETFKSVYTNDSIVQGMVKNTTGIGLEMTEEAKTAKQIEGDFTDPTKALLKAPKMVWDSFDTVKNLAIKTSELLHLPPILLVVFLGIVVFALVFAFISLVFRWRT